MNPYALFAVTTVTVVTVVIGAWGVRLVRGTSDLLVASRMVSPTQNAAAIGGEYLSAASFLGVAGLILAYGARMLWYPVGFAAGYLALLLFVAAPLRRSGAFTLPDFCEARLGSPRLRALATAFVLFIGWFYLLPQLQGAGLTFGIVTGGPHWLGVVLVGAVVTGNVAFGGMRSATYVQAFQYWLKLTAIAVPAFFLLARWRSDGSPSIPADAAWAAPTGGLVGTYSLILATFLGTMGLPHVLARFYTNPDGASARRTTAIVLGLVGVFYLFPAVYGVLGRIYTPQLVGGRNDTVVLLLPGAALGPGLAADCLGALVAAGAFAAFLSTSNGLLTSVAGVLANDVRLPGWLTRRAAGPLTAFRLAALVAGAVPTLLALAVHGLNVSQVVGLAFAVAASSFCPLLVLGIWWRGLTAAGAAAGILAGGGSAVVAVLWTVFVPPAPGLAADLLAQPAAWTVPLSFVVMTAVSAATRRRVPAGVGAMLLRLHAPETLRL
ncbi:sodium/solute symporter [Catellatospora tritici]|uniref:sodium/solute symporter n=1 Tax=Catellatospora tritici TaxID=2851566 RepID=UPI001C2CE27A|nr:cation acetate symporter [Catellatospora tritici]MBV1855485.1 cation acetate symporter [Catellatospora tritici]